MQRKRPDLPSRVYYHHGAYYYVGVDKKWRKLDRDYNKAMARWSEIIRENAPREPTYATVGALLDRYLLEIVPGKAPRTQTDNRQEIRFLRAFFGDMALGAVEPAHVVDYVRQRHAKTRANREVALLSHAFNKAALWGLVSGRNPCSVPGIRNSETARERYVTDDEITQFKKEAPQWLKEYVELKLLLGLRKQDMLNLRWEDIRDAIPTPVLAVTVGKTGKRLAISLTPETQSILARLKNDSSHLFATRSGTAYTCAGFDSTWKRTMSKFLLAGGNRFHEHDLRGKVVTEMDDLQQAQKLMGHKKIATTEIYRKARMTDVVTPHTRRKDV